MKKILYGFLMCTISLLLTNNVVADDTNDIEIPKTRDDLTVFISKGDALSHIDKIKTDNIEFNSLKKMVNSKDDFNAKELEKISNLYYKLCIKHEGSCGDDTDEMLKGLHEDDFDNVDIDEMVRVFDSSEQESTPTNTTTDTNTSLSETTGVITGAVAEKLTDEDDETDSDIEAKEKLYNVLSGASTAAMGLGAMEAAQALSEKKQDAAAERDMTAYLATMRCEIAKGKTYKLSNEDIELDGGNELIKYVSEYKELAARLKKAKNALNIAAGIESEEILDKADGGLYEYTPAVKGQSAFGSLANALRDENSEDAKKWAEQKEKTQKRLVIGASVAAAGLVAAVATNLTLGQDIRDARAEESNTSDEIDALIEIYGKEELLKMLNN